MAFAVSLAVFVLLLFCTELGTSYVFRETAMEELARSLQNQNSQSEAYRRPNSYITDILRPRIGRYLPSP
ncbi:hypothetical protein AAVH_32679 [Aphelenchoides avenae]|nr:hypothetical protein AAVH_32679 [Aphelenchus avenae]